MEDRLNYGGFYIEKPIGNNIFSYDNRIIKKIYVPQLIDGTIEDVEIGDEPAFVEINEGIENKCIGLKNMYLLKLEGKYSNKEIYLFDNHNHAFYFWCKALKENKFEKACRLVHIDQHKDTRVPSDYKVNIDDINDVIRYTNEVLNVGNFIKPALHMGIFDDVDIVDSTYGLNLEIPKSYVLDIDLDFFSKDMDYIDFEWRINRVKEYIDRANLITIATSPFFIEQEKAIKALKMLFGMEKIHNLW